MVKKTARTTRTAVVAMTSLVGLSVMGMLGFGAIPAYAATTINVATTGSDIAGCGAVASPCLTVAFAYGLASDGDTIHVAAGTYSITTGQLLIQKPGVILEGAQAGVDARTRTVGGPNETVIVADFTSGGGTFTLDADNVTVNGFTFEGNADGAGVETTSNHSGYNVLNNVFTNNSMGVNPGSNGAIPSVYTQNLYVANNNNNGGNGIFTSDWWALSNASFTNSDFQDNANTPIDIDGRAVRVGVDTATGITITGNKMTNEGPIFLVAVTNATISNNTTNGGWSGVELSGDDHNVTITDNTITNKSHGGVLVVMSNAQFPNTGVTVADNTIQDVATAPGRAAVDISGSSDITVTSNLILSSLYTGADNPTGDNGIAIGTRGQADPANPVPSSNITVTQNTIVGFDGDGVTFAAGSYTGAMELRFNRIVNNGNSDGLINNATAATVDARWNWWGCNHPDSPQPPTTGVLDAGGGPGCGTIKGASAATVTFAPWLMLTIAANPANIVQGQAAAIASALNTDSAGNATTGVPSDTAQPYFRVIPAAFSADTGIVTPSTVTLTPQLDAASNWPSGQALPTRICTTVDHQTICLTWTPAPAISVVKASTSKPTAAGDKIDYTFQVTNTGNVDLADVAVTDTQTAPAGQLDAPPICPSTALAPGASETCTGSYTVTQADVDHNKVDDNATATGTAPDETVVTGESSLEVPIVPVVMTPSPEPSPAPPVGSDASDGSLASSGGDLSASYIAATGGTALLLLGGVAAYLARRRMKRS